MPRENRKRGKRHRKSEKTEEYQEQEPEYQNEETQDYEAQPELARQDGPSWIVSAPQNEDVDREAPFGYVDPDVKAYFRTVDQQLREWIENPVAEHTFGEDDLEEPNAGVCFSCYSLIHTNRWYRKESVLYCCSYGDVGEGKATRDGS